MNTMTLNLNEREMAVVEELAAKHDLSKTAIIRQALRLYQLVDREYERGGHMTLASDADNRRLMFVGLGWPLQALQQAREGLDSSSSATEHTSADALTETSVLAGWARLTDAQRADIEAHIRGLTEERDTYPAPEDGWQCFHCGERFRTYGGARMHFGAGADQVPVCTAATIKSAIRSNVQMQWARDPGGGGGYEFTEASLNRAARAILKAAGAQAALSSGSPPLSPSAASAATSGGRDD